MHIYAHTYAESIFVVCMYMISRFIGLHWQANKGLIPGRDFFSFFHQTFSSFYVNVSIDVEFFLVLAEYALRYSKWDLNVGGN